MCFGDRNLSCLILQISFPYWLLNWGEKLFALHTHTFMPKRQATVLALVCAGHAVSSCFFLNSSDQLCGLFGSTLGSWIVWEDVRKAPASHLCRTVLTQTWLSNPVSHSSCCFSWGQQCWCEQGKIACLAPFWPAVPISWADSILTCRSAWLQLACFGTRLSLTYFFSVRGPAWLLSLLLPYPGTPQLPFHLHGNTAYPTTTHSVHNSYQLISFVERSL